MTDFATLGLSADRAQVVAEVGYEQPTPIQQACIPKILAGADVIAQSSTGSGKTAAFVLPCLSKIDLERRELQLLIISPTRELAAQVARECRKLGRRDRGLAVVTLTGGEPIKRQLAAMERGVHVAVGTPGRLLDLHRREALPHAKVAMLVLDEADRMLEMGFQEDVNAIAKAMPSSRQTLLFSATIPDSVARISEALQTDAIRIQLEKSSQEAPAIRQFALTASPAEKPDALFWALGSYPHKTALVFCNFKKTVAEIDSLLAESGLSVDCLHGDLEQFDRNEVLAKFRNHSVRILVATDVAARGIDLTGLDLVINYELPKQPDVYVHRIGRTGRAGESGTAVAIATPREASKLDAFEARTTTTMQRPKDPDFASAFSNFRDELAVAAPMKTIRISGGRKNKIRAGDILGALTGDAGGLAGEDIGKIEIHDRLTYVAVARDVAAAAARSLSKGRIKNKRFRAILIS